VLGGPVAALLHDAYGSWMPVFGIIIAMNFATALLAGLALKPMRQRWLADRTVTAPAAAPAIPAR
jgi:MFS transporter, OFA family, oxalate/formate antiporter